MAGRYDAQGNICLIDGGINNTQVRLQVRLLTVLQGLNNNDRLYNPRVISAGGQSIAERQTAGGPNSVDRLLMHGYAIGNSLIISQAIKRNKKEIKKEIKKK